MIYYKYTNTGYRELKIEDIKKHKEKIEEIKKSAEFIRMFGSKVYEYKSIEEREMIK